MMKFQNKYTLLTLLTLVAMILSFTSNVIANPITATTQSEDTNTAIINGLEYLQSQINNDGGIRWMDETSSVAVTVRVVIALAASGFSQNTLISDDGNRPIDYLKTAGGDWVFQVELDEPSLNVARAGQLLTAIAAANENPEDFGITSLNLIHTTKSSFDPNTGIFGAAGPENVLDQVWAIIGLTSSNAKISTDAAVWLASVQLPDGSWNDGFGSFLDTTPLGILALMASGAYTADSPEVHAALAFMKNNQQSEGGWKTEWDTLTNVNITGLMLQAIAAVGQDPSIDWATANGNPRVALASLQQDTGVIGVDYANAYSTADAIIGLSNQPIYQLGRVRQVSRAFEFIFNQQEANGGWGSVGQSIDIMLAAAAAGWNPDTIVNNGNSPVDFVSENMISYIETGPDAVGKLILGAALAGKDPTDFNGINLIEELMESYSPESNTFGAPDNTWHQALALLGLYASNVEIPKDAQQGLIALQQPDGGWEYLPEFGTSPDNTAIAIQGLLAAGLMPEHPVIQNALSFLQSEQLSEGGWGDSSQTSFAIMALNALEIPPEDWSTETGISPITNLMTYQKPTGALMFSSEYPDENLMATSSALLAVFSGNYLIHPTEQKLTQFAGLVIVAGEGEIVTTCVPLNSQSISGLELLQESGVDYAMQDGFIDSIMNIKNPQGGTMYWSFWHWDGREWLFNNNGAADLNVFSGDIEAWYFTSWEVYPSLPPAFIPNLHQICNATVLKNHTTQPYLNYSNLYPSLIDVMDQTTFSESQPALEPTKVIEGNSTPMPLDAEQELETTSRSSFPIILIGAAGVIVVILIATILLKKKR